MCAAIVLASWGIAARTYATSGGGGYNDGLFASLIVAAMTLTIGAAILVAWAWRDRLKPLLAALVSVLAALSILCLALAINLRG